MASSPRPSEVTRVFGDGRWWTRADALSHPQCRAFVDDLDAVRAELRALYPAEVCRRLADDGLGGHVLGLFLGEGWMDDVDEMLQLGQDLTLCSGWRRQAKLVSDLRRPDAYDAARFEVGVWAGLRRIGLAPVHEDAVNRARRRPDFVVVDGGARVALELKCMADPNGERNVGLLQSYLSLHATGLLNDEIGEIVFEPSSLLEELFEQPVDTFRRALDSRIWPVVAESFERRLHVGTIEVGDLGVLHVGPREPTWVHSMVGRTGVRTSTDDTTVAAARRVLGRVVEARQQLDAVDVDVRVAVVRGSLDHAPCVPVANEIVRRLREGFDPRSVDYIALLNGHRRGPVPGWNTETAVVSTRSIVPPYSPRWPRGLVAWTNLHSAAPLPFSDTLLTRSLSLTR